MSTIRNDSHRPSAIVPDNYEFVACEHIKTEGDPGLCEYQNEQRATIRAHMASTGGTYSRHEHGGNCHVCGSVNLIYSILFYHEPSNSYIRVGEDCAEKLEMGGTREMSAFRAAMRSALEAQAGKAKAQAILAERNLSALWAIYTAPAERAASRDEEGIVPGQKPLPYEESTICNIVGKLVRYGSVSERALSFAASLIEKIAKRAEVTAQRAAEAAAAADFPVTEDRIEIIGTVLSVKEQDSNFGIVWKMLVRSDAGWKIWVTAPGNPGKGDKVKFFAKVQPSHDDPKFGFGSRPTKFETLQEAAQAAS